MRTFPGREWDTNFAGFYNDYDPRLRPWYIAATSGPKDVVIVLDCRYRYFSILYVNRYIFWLIISLWLLTMRPCRWHSTLLHTTADSCLIIDCEAGEIIRLVASVCLSICPYVCWSSPVWTVWPMTSVFGKVVGQSSRSYSNNRFGSVNALTPEPFFYWRGVVDSGTGFAKYSKRSSETQVSYILKKHHRVFILRSFQNGWAFKMVVVSTGCAIAVDHTFILWSNCANSHQVNLDRLVMVLQQFTRHIFQFINEGREVFHCSSRG